MKRNIVIVTLTLLEAKALSKGMGNTTCTPDAMLAIFQKRSEREAAISAHQKLDNAIWAADNFLRSQHD